MISTDSLRREARALFTSWTAGRQIGVEPGPGDDRPFTVVDGLYAIAAAVNRLTVAVEKQTEVASIDAVNIRAAIDEARPQKIEVTR